MNKRIVSHALFFVFLFIANPVHGQILNPTKLKLDDGSHLHYVTKGQGDPVVFIHGFLDEYSVWLRQVEGFSREGFQAIAYSRRHSFPNRNSIRDKHSASLEADDLAQLVRKLKLKRIHVIGFSYGAYTALLFEIKYPKLAKTVTLIEPPVVPWLDSLPIAKREEGRKHLEKLMNDGVKRAQKAMRESDEVLGIRSMIDAIGGQGKYDSLPQFVKAKCRRNILELKAFLASADRYPAVDRKRVEQIRVPTLILSGGKSIATAKFTDPELERLIPKAFRKRVIFDGASHVLWLEQPVRFRKTVLEFIGSD